MAEPQQTGPVDGPLPLSVWAPAAQRVEVEVDAAGERSTLVLTASPDGWWLPSAADLARYDLASGPVDYAFRVDGGDRVPDPRSAWQPEGVHGPSRYFDVRAHSWGDALWAGPQQGAGTLGGVVYELHVGTFTAEGTLDAAIERLGHLVELGVDVVELLPLAAFPGEWGWGYDGVDPYAVHHPYGGPAAFQRFVDACHQQGLGVCLDVVYNHLGPSGNYLGTFGPYFSDDHHTPWGQGVNLDGEGSLEVRRYVIDNAVRWLRDFHVDALRLDAVHELHDDSDRHLLAELADEVADLERALGRPLTLIAESDLNDPVMVTPTREGGYGMSAQWADDLHHALHVTLTGETQGYYADFGGVPSVAKTLTRVFFHDGVWSSFRDSEWGAPVDRAVHDGRRFVGYLQTHDQIGNRATGDRISALLTPGQQAIGAALYLTSALTPMVFMGEEWAASTPWQFFSDHQEPELAAAVSAGRRREFAGHGWDAEQVPDPQERSTRDASVLRWDERTSGGHARMLHWYRLLIALRRAEAALTDGRLDLVEVTFDEAAGWLLVRRGDLAVAANLAAHSQLVPVAGGVRDVVLAWDPTDTEASDEGLRLGPHGVAVGRV